MTLSGAAQYFKTVTSLSPIDSPVIPSLTSQNYPNPFNPSTTIRYGLPSSSNVTVKVFNILGEQIADLVNAEQSAGWHETTWDASVASGVYFYRIAAVSLSEPGQRSMQMKKMILLK
jgi:hypothetical protein